MLLTIEERSPLFLDKQETTMTTMTKLSALTLVAATVLGAAALAPTSASARGYVGGFRHIASSVTANFHLRATALTSVKPMPFRQNAFAVRRVFAPPMTMMPVRQNAFAAGFKLAPLRQMAVAGQLIGRIGVTTPVAHQPPGGAPAGAKPDLDIGGALNTIKNAINTVTDVIADVVERVDTDPGPTCGWAVCSDGSNP
jgi:hypothetical protein